MKCKIGIRLIVDGRDTVRDVIEDKAKLMGKAAEKLITSTLTYSDGTPVECITGITAICCAKEAIMVEEQFIKENVVATLSVTPSFCYGTETLDLNPHTIKAIWGFNSTERPGAVYLACAQACYAEKGLPVFSIYGKDVQDMDDNTIPVDVAEKILLFAKSSIAVGEMKNTSYLAIGNVSMGIIGSYVDSLMLQQYLAMRSEWIDMSEVKRRIDKEIYDKKEYAKALLFVKKNCQIGIDYNDKEKQHSQEQKEIDWEYSVKMAIIFKDLMQGNETLKTMGYREESYGHGAIVAGFQGQRQWTDYLPNADFAEAILNSSFDWNGVRKPYILATENDSLNGLSMLFQHLLTKGAAIFADVRTFWSNESIKRVTGKELTGIGRDGFIHLNNSGAAALDGAGVMKENKKPVIKKWFDVTNKDVEAMLKATDWCAANLNYFKSGGYSSHYVTRAEMPMTMFRINRILGVGPVMQIVEGYSLDLDRQISDIVEKRTDPGWPSTFFTPILTGKGQFTDVYSVMKAWGANHCSIAYGHIGHELITLAAMLRMPVCMHNVDRKRIYRPQVWDSFGTENLESADYLACKTLGPLYK